MMTTPMKSRYALLRLIAMRPIVTGLLAAFGFTSKAAEIRIQDKLPSAYTPTDPPAETAEKTASPENEDYVFVPPMECDKKKGASSGSIPGQTLLGVYLFYVQPILKSDSRAVSCNRPFRSPPWVSSPS